MTCPPTCFLTVEPCLEGAPLAWTLGTALSELEVGDGLHLVMVFSEQGYWRPYPVWKHVPWASWVTRLWANIKAKGCLRTTWAVWRHRLTITLVVC